MMLLRLKIFIRFMVNLVLVDLRMQNARTTTKLCGRITLVLEVINSFSVFLRNLRHLQAMIRANVYSSICSIIIAAPGNLQHLVKEGTILHGLTIFALVHPIITSVKWTHRRQNVLNWKNRQELQKKRQMRN